MEGANGTNLIAALANAKINGEPIGHGAAMGFTLTLIVAGHETTMNGIASTLGLIGAHPETKEMADRRPEPDPRRGGGVPATGVAHPDDGPDAYRGHRGRGGADDGR